MHPNAKHNPKSELFQWLLAVFFIFELLALPQAIASLVAPTAVAEFMTSNFAVTLGFNCMMSLGWAVPILAILTLAMAKSRRYAPDVRQAANLILVTFGLKMVIGVGWAAFTMMTMLQYPSRSNAATMSQKFIAEHPAEQYLMVVVTLGISLIGMGLVLRTVRRLAGAHILPPPENPELPRNRRR